MGRQLSRLARELEHKAGCSMVWRPPAWHDQAACKDHDAADWFPNQGENLRAMRARQICRTECPVQAICLAEALDTPPNQDWGIRGGTTEGERRDMRRRRPVSVLAGSA